MPRKVLLQVLALAACLLTFTPSNTAQTSPPRGLITQAIDETKLVTLAGNTRPEANRKSDVGPAPNDLHLDMYLQLKRSPQQELAAKQFVESLTTKGSPNFHKWISAAEYGRRFGAAPEDIATVSRWLQSHGFTVNHVPANNMVIDFSGAAGQVREALHTEIRNFEVAGKRYFANIGDPQIPAALLPAVTGVVSLHNFRPHPMLVPRAQYTVSSTSVALVPGDLATIYNLNSAFAAGFTGAGQTVVVVEDTDLYNGSGDWNAFRKTFGLTQYSGGSLTQVHPATGAGGACIDPGINGDAVEAALDVEWASAAAPNAAIHMAACEGTTNFGGFIALQNLLTNGGPLPSVVSISYGESEAYIGAAQNAYINTLYQTAAAAGVSVFASTGDSNAAGNDRGESVAIHGINVSGFASTIYNVAVGGTDFSDYTSGVTGTFWNSTNGAYYDSAKSYVPEIPWNDSCGSLVLAHYYGFTANDTTSGICNSLYEWLNTDGGSGGPSACATGVAAISGIVSGSCAGYPKPSWQSISGNPSDGVRDMPDVSLFAAAGIWGHYYVFCYSSGASCSGAPSTWAGGGGTSFSSPIMAGIQAVINQALGENNVGNPNPVYYQIAQSQYSAPPKGSACNSSTGPASTCSFNDVTQGDIVVPCAGAFNCYLGGGGLGVLSTSNTSDQPAYAAAPGWDFATGIGTVNAFNLLNSFVGSVSSSAAPPAPVLVSPADAASGVSPTTLLTWNASDGAMSYDVYFGTDSTPPAVANTPDLNYSPGALSAGSTYYWAIAARNSTGATASTPRSFTTSCVAALNPATASSPAAGGTGTIPITAAASCTWTASSSATWITISGNTGSGNGAVAYTLAADAGAQRSGTITIAGQTFTITQAGIYPLISTLTGGSMPPTPAPGNSVSIPASYGIAVDSSGNTYFPSPTLNAVFKADPSGVVTRIAGTGNPGRAGDEGPALLAELNSPYGVAVDSSGNVYIADTGNRIVRKVDGSGNISTAAGDGSCCTPSGDGGPAAGAAIGEPYSLAVDSSGNLFISDLASNIVRRVAASGTISTVAGTGSAGYSGDNLAATGARLNGPYGLAVDASGNLYIADRFNFRIRMVSTAGTITTVAGNGKCCYNGDGAAATNSMLDDPSGVAVDSSGNIYIADTYNYRVRQVNATGTMTTVAGNGLAGFSGDGAAASSSKLVYPEGVAVDSSGNLYITDSGNSRIRKVNAGGNITTLVGGAVNDGAQSVSGLLNQPSGVARDNAGNTYVSDTLNNRVRKIAANGSITTVAGTGMSAFAGDNGAAASAQLNAPQGLALDSSGNLYIADTNNHRVRMVDASGNITTVAGNGNCCSSTGDGAAAINAGVGTPYGLAVDASGNLYISDISNNVVRMVSSGTISTVAGNGTYGYAGDGGPAIHAEMRDPWALAVDASGNLYIADRYNYRVRMVSGATGTITTVAGNGNCCYSGDGNQATKAMLYDPSGLAVDASGNLYIADTYNERIRQVTPAGIIATVAGNGSSAYSGDGGLANGATFALPSAVAVDAVGNLVVADLNNNAVRLLTPAYTQPVLSIQSGHSGNFTPGQTATYTLTVSNGPAAGATTGTVTVTELLPSGVTLSGMSGAGWTCSSSPSTCTRSDALTGGSSYPAITVTVTVSTAASGQVTNTASVSGGGGNVARAQDLTIVAPPGASADRRGRR